RHAAIRIALKALTGKARESREAQRTEDAVGVHVVDAGLDVPGTATHMFVAERFHSVLFLRPADHGIEAHVAGGFFFEFPNIAATALHDFRLAALIFGGHVACEGVRRLDRVIVYADENE